MVGITKCLLDDCLLLALGQSMFVLKLTVPRVVPVESLNIDQYPLELGDGEGWVSVVELNSNLVGKFLPRTLALLETSNNVVKRGCTPKVLLLQAKLLATVQACQSQFMHLVMFEIHTCRWGRERPRWFQHAAVQPLSSRTRQS